MTFFPNLRFPGFEGEWKNKKLGEIADIYDGTHQTPKYTSNGVKFVSVENINDLYNTNKFISEKAFEKEYKIKPRKGDILMTRITAGIIGATAIVQNDNPLAYYVSLALIRIKTSDNINFLAQRIETKEFKNELHKRIIHVAFPKKINLGDIYDCSAYFPESLEQEKISSFLSLLNSRIQTQNKIIEQLETLMQGWRERIFSRKVRFKSDENKFSSWEIKKLKDISIRVTTKNKESNRNVLTISAQYGLISQLDFFSKSVSAKNIDNYYLLEKNDFAYNKSYSNGYPMGAIKKLINYETGVVSTLYICFRFHNYINSEYMKHYFDSGCHNVEIEKIAQEGARNHGLLNISITDFFDINISLPPREEQTKISNFLSSSQEKIEMEKQILQKLELQKKFLLANLFV